MQAQRWAELDGQTGLGCVGLGPHPWVCWMSQQPPDLGGWDVGMELRFQLNVGWSHLAPPFPSAEGEGQGSDRGLGLESLPPSSGGGHPSREGRDVVCCAGLLSRCQGCWAWGGVCSEASATMRIPCCEWVQSSERQAGERCLRVRESGDLGTLLTVQEAVNRMPIPLPWPGGGRGGRRPWVSDEKPGSEWGRPGPKP